MAALGDSADLGELGQLIMSRGLASFVVADRDLSVVSAHGGLADGVAIGQKLCDAVPPLFGLEEQIGRLRQHPGETLEVPNVAVVRPDGDAPRLSYVLFWDDGMAAFVLMIQRSLTASDVSIELQRQVRRRMLAEAELVEQAKVVEAANRSLSKVNRDLADFARIVSHDLKSPMRALRYFADDLEQALDDPSGGDDPRHHLDQLRQQSQRMSSMLTGLLAYTRLERKEEAAAAVDLGGLVRRVVASLPRPQGIDVSVEGDWPTVMTHEAPLDLILRNLVDNAIKHHDADRGAIMVRCAHVAGSESVQIEIEDDGPGIPDRYHNDIFKPFTRLTNEADGGVGMGLTLVHRAVESLGGSLSIHSNHRDGRGVTFRLLCPVDNVKR